MVVPGIVSLVLLVVFLTYLTYTTIEQKRGVRIVAPRLRLALDVAVESVAQQISAGVRYIVRYIITLSWYYSLHTLLKLTLRFLASIYHAVEAILIRNRDRARVIRKERRASSHLEQIAEHKAETKLSPAEERKRKDKALKGH